jgi:DNA-binding beta-propeller fold protein YncE
VFSSDGKFLFKFGSEGSENEQFHSPRGSALTNSGQLLLVCDYGNHRIQLFNTMNAKFLKSYGLLGSSDGQFECPIGICILTSGQIIISEAYYNGNQHRVQIFE